MIRSPRPAALVCATAALLVLAGCSGSSHSTKSAAPTPAPKTSPAPSSTAKGSKPAPKPKKPPRPLAVGPLTGAKPNAHGVVAVKIDDTAHGRPQLNIDQADVVYIEQVEGGLTRLLAVFNSKLPSVAAVRSTRASDPELLGSYGPIAYVASGGARNPLSVLHRSPLKADINDKGGPGFQRDGNRFAPYNLQANLYTIAKQLRSPKARYVGYRWSAGSAVLKGRGPGRHVRTTVGSTPVAFDYFPKINRYARYIDGSLQHTASGKFISTPNVIVQFCSVTTYYKDIDVNHNPSKFTHTIGKGGVVVFRDGKRIYGTWQRKHYTGVTRFADSKGKPIFLRPGGAWVVLVANGTRLG